MATKKAREESEQIEFIPWVCIHCNHRSTLSLKRGDRHRNRKIICGKCHQKTSIKEYVRMIEAIPDVLEALEIMLDTHRVDAIGGQSPGTPSVRGDWLEARRKAVSAISKGGGG